MQIKQGNLESNLWCFQSSRKTNKKITILSIFLKRRCSVRIVIFCIKQLCNSKYSRMMQISQFERQNGILQSFILPHFGYNWHFFTKKQVCKQPRGTYTKKRVKCFPPESTSQCSCNNYDLNSNFLPKVKLPFLKRYSHQIMI